MKTNLLILLLFTTHLALADEKTMDISLRYIKNEAFQEPSYVLDNHEEIKTPTKESIACMKKLMNYSSNVLQVLYFSKGQLSSNGSAKVNIVLNVKEKGTGNTGGSVITSGNEVTIAGNFVPENPPEFRCTFPEILPSQEKLDVNTLIKKAMDTADLKISDTNRNIPKDLTQEKANSSTKNGSEAVSKYGMSPLD